jgi:hypothetical protein
MILSLLLAAAVVQAGVAERRYAGPAVVCGEVFALRIAAEERAVARDSGTDFFTYHVEGPDGGFVLYEGNAPQPHDDEIRTGQPWPNVIAIHDNRSARAKAAGRVRDRLVLGRERIALCPPRVPPLAPR